MAQSQSVDSNLGGQERNGFNRALPQFLDQLCFGWAVKGGCFYCKYFVGICGRFWANLLRNARNHSRGHLSCRSLGKRKLRGRLMVSLFVC
jgi:hypothetical protein